MSHPPDESYDAPRIPSGGGGLERSGRLAYFDCIGGISGDMTLGALIDAGADEDALRRGLESLGLPAWALRVRRVQKHAISALSVEVIDHVAAVSSHEAHTSDHQPGEPGTHLDLHTPTHSHTATQGEGADREQTHEHQHEHAPVREVRHAHGGHSHGHSASRSHEHEHEHEHEQGHTHTHGRGLTEILRMIRGSGLPEGVKERASAVFQQLGEVEAKIHALPVETIHFHEVGAVDSIIDIVGSVLALHLLGIERIVCSPLPTGHGFVRAAHGLMPIPAPATMELLKGIPTRPVDVSGELVTPTGAVLMATLADEFGWMPAMRVEAIGYGAGKKEFPFPNLLRVCVGVGVER